MVMDVKMKEIKVYVWDVKGAYLGTGEKTDVFGDDVPDGLSEIFRMLGHPKIVLSDGRVLFGCQCWWKPTSKMEAPPEQLDFEQYRDFMSGLARAIGDEADPIG